MNNILLNVPFAEKEIAKELGAKWDSKNKIWYIPPGLDAKLFKRWICKSPSSQRLIIKEQIALLRGLTKCWRCKGMITVHALATHCVEHNGLEQHGFYVLAMIQELPGYLAQFLELRCPLFKIGKADDHGVRYYRNHCDHCNSGVSDARLHDLGVIFNPESRSRFKLELIYLPLEGSWEVAGIFYDYSSHEILLSKIEKRYYISDLL